jgi:hypothetical protein
MIGCLPAALRIKDMSASNLQRLPEMRSLVKIDVDDCSHRCTGLCGTTVVRALLIYLLEQSAAPS